MSDNMDLPTITTTPAAQKKKVYICLPKRHMKDLANHYKLEHGLIIKGLTPHINPGYLKAYFREWGTVTSCKIKKKMLNDTTMAYVRFALEEDADRADWAGPHYIGGYDVEVRRVVSPRTDEDSEEEVIEKDTTFDRPRRSVGMGYILGDAQWLDDEAEE